MNSIWFADGTNRRFLELFVLGLPAYRQRFQALASAPTGERFYRLIQGWCAHVEELREPSEGAIRCEKTTTLGGRLKKRGWATGKVIDLVFLYRNG